MQLYKLTDQDMRTYNGTQWTLGEWKQTDAAGDLCGKGWLHAYTDPILGLLLNPMHANIITLRLFVAEALGPRGGNPKFMDDKGLKCGVNRLRLVRELELPTITTEDRVRFAILCSLEVYKGTGYVAWANGWLSGTDRLEKSAGAGAAAWAAAAEAAAWAAAGAAEAEAAAAAAAAAGAAAGAAAAGAWAAAGAAAAAGAEAAAGAAEKPLDLPALAHRACQDSLQTWQHTREFYPELLKEVIP